YVPPLQEIRGIMIIGVDDGVIEEIGADGIQVILRIRVTGYVRAPLPIPVSDAQYRAVFQIIYILGGDRVLNFRLPFAALVREDVSGVVSVGYIAERIGIVSLAFPEEHRLVEDRFGRG